MTYRSRAGRGMIETYSDFSGRDRYDDHVERFSVDNGKSWGEPRLVIPSQEIGGTVTRGMETINGRDPITDRVFRAYVMAVYVHDADDASVERSHQRSTLYVQYSLDGGETFQPRMDLSASAADSPVFARTPAGIEFHPLLSCSQLETLADGTLLIPVMRWACAADGGWSPMMNGQPSCSVCMAIGRWNSGRTEIHWSWGQPIAVDTRRAVGGLSEASIAPWGDGRLLAVARGDNGSNTEVGSCKWWSFSNDRGQTWSEARPLRDTRGECVHSPASYGRVLRHSSGRHFLISNLYDQPCCNGGGPRHALHVAEVGTDGVGNPAIIAGSILTIDQRREGESESVALSNFSVYEDRFSRELRILCPRAFATRESIEDCDCMSYRVAVN